MTQEEINNTNWTQAVAGVCICDGKVLLARHTYGNGNGMLIIPGGYVKFGETPADALSDETVPGLTKTMIECALSGKGFALTPYQTTRTGNFLFTGIEEYAEK